MKYQKTIILGIILTALIMSFPFYPTKKEKEEENDYVNNNISLNGAPILEIEDVKSSDIAIGYKYRFLKLDVNKNGVFDDGDIIVKTARNLPLIKDTNIIYFEDKQSNENGIVAYQGKDNNYILNNGEKFLNSRYKTKQILKKLPEYMTDINQRQ
ncbi:hypothetical protein HDR59_00270 [bacterium]|nr:hypothetical protein [bacterium]